MMDYKIEKNNTPTFKKKSLSLGFLIIGLITWLCLLAGGLTGYSGSKITYILFSIVTGWMLVLGFRQRNSYGYLFLTVFLWLGFWFKLTIHAIFIYPFVEPVGSFSATGSAWDEVLQVASVGSVGVILGQLFFGFIKSHINFGHIRARPVIPSWYAASRKWLWIILIFVAVLVFFLNIKYGIHQIGLAPRTVLMWPLNAGIAWFLNIGLATAVAALLWEDIRGKKNIAISIYSVIAEALISSVSILSRAIYVFHAIPQLWVVYQLRNTLSGWSRAKTLLIVIIFTASLVVSISAVTTLRNYLFQSGVYSSTAYQEAYARWEVLQGAITEVRLKIKTATPAEVLSLQGSLSELLAEQQILEGILVIEKTKWNDALNSGSTESKVLLNEFGYQVTNGFAKRILQLSVDRWIGLEGVMAVQSYEDKSIGLLWKALTNKSEVDRPDIYQAISNSIYLKSDTVKFRFATLPGISAFLYYSNSLFIVLLGTFIFSLAILFIEVVISGLTENPILCSLYGAMMASNVSQFGISPRQSLPYYLMLAFGILLIWLVRTRSFDLLLQKIASRNT